MPGLTLNEALQCKYPFGLTTEKQPNGVAQYAAFFLDMPGCIAQGVSDEAAIEALEEIRPAYLKNMAELGLPIPEPTPQPNVAPRGVGIYDRKTGSFSTDHQTSLEDRVDRPEFEDYTPSLEGFAFST